MTWRTENNNEMHISIKGLAEEIRSEFEPIFNALNNIVGDNTRLSPSELPPMIYHYTDDQGLKGILETGELWFTHVFDLNDPSEIQHGYQIGRELFLKALPDDVVTARELFPKFNSVNELKLNFYTCSFSSDKDELGQWRAYGDDGRGYAIGFDARSMSSSKDLAAFGIRYDDEHLTKQLDRIVQAAMPLVVKYGDVANPSPEAEALGYLLATITSSLVTTSTQHKHQDYRAEREIRLLRKFASRYQPLYRTRPYSLVKYLKYPFKEAHPIKEIVVGPSTKETSQKFVEDCLKAFYSGRDVTITRSSIPYRSTRITR